MTKQVQRRRGTSTQHTSFTGAEGEISVNTTNKSVHVHDGVTAGGVEAARADLTNVSDANLNAALSGNTLSSLTITSVDINGGTIDGTVIGGTSAAAGTFTTVTGTSFVSSGDMTFGDSDKAIFGAGSDLQIYHDGTNSYIDDQGTGRIIIKGNDDVRIRSGADEEMIVASSNGAVTLYHDSLPKFTTNATGVGVTGNATFADNGKAIFGAGSDLQIYHDGVNNWVDAVSGVLLVRGSRVDLRGANDELLFVGNQNGAVTLYHDNAAKLATTATGIDVTGTVTADGLTVDGAGEFVGTSGVQLKRNTTPPGAGTGANALNWQMVSTGSTYVTGASIQGISDGAWSSTSAPMYLSLRTVESATTTLKERVRIANNGDISFYEPTGITPKFFWDASAESLGIGTTSPSDNLTVVPSVNNKGITIDYSAGSARLTLTGNAASAQAITFGDSSSATSGQLIYDNSVDAMRINTNGSERMRIDSSGNVGIGVSAPAFKLEVDSVSVQSVVNFIGTTGAYVRITNDTGMAEVGSTGDNLILRTSSLERLRIDSSGNVGIGTSVPSDYNASADNLVVGTTSGNNGITIAAGTASQGSLYFADGTATAAEEAAGYLVYVHTDDSMRVGTGNTERMRITSAGNVGLGTSSPLTRLDTRIADAFSTVVSNTSLNNNTSTVARFSFLTDPDPSITAGTGVAISISATPNRGETFLVSTHASTSKDESDFAVWTTNGGVASEKMRVTKTGNVGIGTSSPAFLLDVNGSARINGSVLADTGTASVPTLGFAGWVGTGIYNPTGTSLGFSTNAAERMRIDSSGNVGIGTSSPSSLDSFADDLVVGNGVGPRGITIYSDGATSNTAYGGIFFADGTSTNSEKFAGFVQYHHFTDSLRLATAATERMRIDASGNLLVGTTSNSDGVAGIKLRASNEFVVERDGLAIKLNRISSNGEIVRFQRGGSTVGDIQVTTTTTTYNTSSDYRLKEDVQPMVGASDRVLSLNPVNFAWKADGTRTDGFIAHEVQAVAPQAVTGEKDGEEMQAIDHSKLVPLLTAALQEALTEIAGLKARITALEA